MLASAVKKYIDYYGVRCGLENVIFTNNDSAYETALSLNKSGTKLNAIVDIRDNSSSEIVNQVKSLGIQIYWNHAIVDTKGYKRINKVTIMKLNDKGNDVIGKKIELNCDCLAISGGWTPMVHLFTPVSYTHLTLPTKRIV